MRFVSVLLSRHLSTSMHKARKNLHLSRLRKKTQKSKQKKLLQTEFGKKNAHFRAITELSGTLTV